MTTAITVRPGALTLAQLRAVHARMPEVFHHSGSTVPLPSSAEQGTLTELPDRMTTLSSVYRAARSLAGRKSGFLQTSPRGSLVSHAEQNRHKATPSKTQQHQTFPVLP